ncbi:hypothetical protein CASFOL_027022 [Castilleja foliolosa]|uniref:Uncharacterized protein n=1 Tax=Castilleja foliolosa TaxID=1961234 RepID=A0ABD3CM26_9LAMI
MAEFRRSGGANVVRATQLTPGECGGGNGRRPVARERARNPGERGGGKGRLPTAQARATNFCKSAPAGTAELMASAVIAHPDYSCLRGSASTGSGLRWNRARFRGGARAWL